MPEASSRASSPATRTADGPMSTPRRDCPRSSGTPMIRILRGGLHSAVDGAGGRLWMQLLPRPGFHLPTQASAGLRIDTVQGAGEGYGFAHVFESAYPGHSALDAHAEAGMRNGAVARRSRYHWKASSGRLCSSMRCLQQIVGGDALRAADDFAVAFRREHVDAEREFRIVAGSGSM